MTPSPLTRPKVLAFSYGTYDLLYFVQKKQYMQIKAKKANNKEHNYFLYRGAMATDMAFWPLTFFAYALLDNKTARMHDQGQWKGNIKVIEVKLRSHCNLIGQKGTNSTIYDSLS